jgi:hypothetical protein
MFVAEKAFKASRNHWEQSYVVVYDDYVQMFVVFISSNALPVRNELLCSGMCSPGIYPDDTADLADCSVHGSSRKFLNVDPNTQPYMLYSCFSTDIYGSVITTSSMLSYRPDPLRLLTNNFHEQQIEK